MSQIKENKQGIGVAIQSMALRLLKVLRMEWKQLVFSVSRQNIDGRTIFTDVLFVMREGNSHFEDALSREFRKSIDRSVLIDISDNEKAVYDLCLAAGDNWNQMTLCIDSQGHFNTFFGYPKPGRNPDPFDRENFTEWESQFLAPEE